MLLSYDLAICKRNFKKFLLRIILLRLCGWPLLLCFFFINFIRMINQLMENPLRVLITKIFLLHHSHNFYM